ncbi:hypothetical protein BKA67DRAFT_541356 [Truncatella angustata]|uniref:Uncharacterized protein n=1 Tax=Truncatella angustata TaxID=152316 RepID=A0A9P8RI05_9PEZI|nr:uncharacterized protein BKA67DRAFT_541356 [Truncatella angustata]KAH6646389.1 hypothetical protein BKA67DRAFT_541356 [Truncatella angustata]KAH8200022.1 hypothetical protein TruAng_005798 [Truncatella angustata]
MLRLGVTALAFVALARGAPVSKAERVLKQRQFQIGPTPTVIWGGTTPTAIPTSGPGTLPPITGGLNPPPRREDTGPVLGGSDSALKAHITSLELEYEFYVQQYGKNPPEFVTKREKEIELELKKYGITIIQTPDGTSTTITFGKVKRQDSTGPTLGGSDPSALKAHIISLELEYEFYVQQYGKNPPAPITQREREIENELKKYGITIIQTPDGTSTTITFGKVKREDALVGGGGYGAASFDLAGLEKTLESLWDKYGPNPPHDVYVIEEKIKHVLLAYGVTIVQSPEGTSTTLYPSTKRSSPSYDIESLEVILGTLLQKYNGERPPLADWLVIQHIGAVLKSYGTSIEQSPSSTVTITKPSDKRDGVIKVGDSVNVIALQALLALLEATYGTAPPRDIFLIEQTIVIILKTQGIIIPGFPIPGGAITPDPTIPGGGITPDPTIPGGGLNPSTKRTSPKFDVEGLQAALALLGDQYGAYGSGTIPMSVFIIMQNVVTILQAEGVTVPAWPNVGGGSTTIGPST